MHLTVEQLVRATCRHFMHGTGETVCRLGIGLPKGVAPCIRGAFDRVLKTPPPVCDSYEPPTDDEVTEAVEGFRELAAKADEADVVAAAQRRRTRLKPR